MLALLGALVDKSLVACEVAPEGPRLRLLETLRSYALEELDKRGEAAAAHRRHRDYYLRLAESGPQHDAVARRKWVDQLVAHLDDFQAALAWSFGQDDPTPGLRLVVALRDVWFFRERLDEAPALVPQNGAGQPEPHPFRGREGLPKRSTNSPKVSQGVL